MMAVALGRTPEDEYRENLHEVSKVCILISINYTKCLRMAHANG